MDHIPVEFVHDPQEGGFTARIPDIPAYGEGDNEESALADLREAVSAYISAYGTADALARLNSQIRIQEIRASSLKDFAFA